MQTKLVDSNGDTPKIVVAAALAAARMMSDGNLPPDVGHIETGDDCQVIDLRDMEPEEWFPHLGQIAIDQKADSVMVVQDSHIRVDPEGFEIKPSEADDSGDAIVIIYAPLSGEVRTWVLPYQANDEGFEALGPRFREVASENVIHWS